MSSVLIKVEGKSYGTIEEFLEDLFYKDKKLADVSFKLLNKIYESEFGIKSIKWQSNISELFKVYPLVEVETKLLEQVHQKYANIIEKGRGKKPYAKLLDKNKKGEITLIDEEKIILEKAESWNSAISSYYSILRKLKNLGLIEKKKSYFVKSKKFLDFMKNIEKLVSNIGKRDEDVYVSK